MRCGVMSLAVLAALLLGAAPALSQEPAAPITPPRAAGPIGVPYPEGGTGAARVVLELVVDAHGAVLEAKAIEGPEPFASAATRSALTWLFEPAQQNGKSVAAKIRFEAVFPAPEPVPVPVPVPEREPVPVPVPGARAPRPEPAKAPIEVVVTGERRSPTVVSLGRAEVRELPGSFGDPFRAIEAMPGVTPIISGVPFFFVRGAPPGNVGYFLDGIRVPYLYHIGLGPSVVHPAIVERVDLYPGGYPARYGRFAGGIVAGETTPPRYEFHGEGSVRLVDAGLLMEAPFASGRGAALAGGRYSYTGLLLTLLSEDAVLEYWDYQARVAYELAPHDTVSAFGFGAYDFLGEKHEDGTTSVGFATEFHRVDLRYDHVDPNRTRFRLGLTAGVDLTRAEEDDLVVRDRLIGLRAEMEHRSSSKLTVRGGVDGLLDFYDVTFQEDEPQPVFGGPGAQPVPPDESGQSDEATLSQYFPDRVDLAAGIWSDLVLDPEPGVTITPGLRVDFYESNGQTALGVDPRISARFEVTPKLRFIHAFGIAHQRPSFVIPIPGFQPADLGGGLQRSLQASSGFELDLPEDFTASLTFFDNVFLEMTDVLSVARNTQGPNGEEQDELDQLLTRSLGSSMGFEVFIRRPLTRRLGGFLSYTLSRSMRSIGSERFPARFDRAHVLNLALGYDLGRRWRAGTRVVFYTGFPAEDLDLELPRSEHPARIPAFYRIDLRLEKRWRIGERAWWAFVIEMLNATLNKEVISVNCNAVRCRNEEIGPVTIPSIGAEFVF